MAKCIISFPSGVSLYLWEIYNFPHFQSESAQMTAGDIIGGKQLPQKPHLKNEGEFDTERLLLSSLHSDRASFGYFQTVRDCLG